MRIFAALAAAAALSIASPAIAQQPPSPLFASNDPIHVVIQAPLSTLIRHRQEKLTVPGSLALDSGEALPVELALRGITRRRSDTCDFPPLRVTFTTPPATSLFAGQRRLKLVTHCRDSVSFQQYVLLEYAAYRMYNVLTPRSFRVRLASIDYRDAQGRPIITRIGYFLEDLRDVAARNALPVTHGPERIPLVNLSAEDSARYTLFQHMMANHDWSVRAAPAGDECCHNAELIGPLAPGATVPIPYDFDFSGFVSAPYALPPDLLRISSVRQRVYRGYCVHNQQAIAVARQMLQARPQMIAALQSTPGLDARTQARALAFLQPFFGDIADDNNVAAKVLNRCAG